MIHIIVHENGSGPVRRLLKTASTELSNIKMVTYQSLFKDLKFPVGTLIFTDFDFLNIIEMEAAARIANAANESNLGIKVLNHPNDIKQRYELLKTLKKNKKSPIDVLRLDEAEEPKFYPFFIRAEDGSWASDSDLIHNKNEYKIALNSLAKIGKPLKGRIATSYHGKRDKAGYFRKYGAFRIGELIIPHHLLRSKDWIVKSGSNEFDSAFATEEFEYIKSNPHAEELMEIFEFASIQYGRIDYSFYKGKIVVFEINTNPTFPKFIGGNPKRNERRAIILAQLKNAFNKIDHASKSPIKKLNFSPPKNGYRWIQSDKWFSLTRLIWRLKIAKRKMSN